MGARILLSCFLGFCYTKDINFMLLRLKFSVFLFLHRRVVGSHILHSSIGLKGQKCGAVQIYVILCYERFVKI